MAVPIISFPQSAFPFKTATTARSAAAGLRASRDATVLAIADTLDTLTTSVNVIEGLIRSCVVVDEAWFKVIGIGGSGYANAPLIVDNNGVISLRTPDLVSVGWLGSKFDAAKTVTGAVDNGAGLIRLTVASHGYITGNTIKVRDVGGVPNATGYWTITYINANQFDLIASTWGGLYTSGGTAQRYYGGAWFQTFFAGGTSADTAKLSIDALGNVSIVDALITLTSGTKSIVLDPTDASITVKDTAVLVDSKVVITAGAITISPNSVANPYIIIRNEPASSVVGMSFFSDPGTGAFQSITFGADNTYSFLTLRGNEAEGIDINTHATAYAPSYLTMTSSRGTVATKAALSSGDIISSWKSRAYRTASTAQTVAAIEVVATTVAVGGVLGTLSFQTSTTGTALAERMVIQGASVGIADASPTAMLDVGGTFRVTGESTPADGVGLEIFYATRSQIRAYNRDTSAWAELWIDASNLILNSQVSTHLVGIGTATPYAKLDVDGMIRSIGGANPSSGAGVELSYQSGEGFLSAYNRSGAARTNLKIAGLLTIVNAGAGAGNVLIGTVTDNASGGKLQVKGDVTPDVDQGGDLGTSGVQWDDIRWKGNLIQNTTTRVSSAGAADMASYSVGGVAGMTQVVALAPLTGGGAAGSATFTGGILTAYSAPT